MLVDAGVRRFVPCVVLGAAVASFAAGCAGMRGRDTANERLTREETFDFQEGAWGGPPPQGFSVWESGEAGPAGQWYLTGPGKDAGAEKVLARRCPDATTGQFPMLVHDPLVARDVDLWVRFQAVAGRIDQAAGIAFRVQDPSNYYVARANALENDVRLFKLVGGERIQVAARDVDVAPGRWHVLKVSARGPRIEVALDGTLVIAAEDAAFGAPGRIGLWTKADSETWFDALKIEVFDRP